jgi:hypothetical protein
VPSSPRHLPSRDRLSVLTAVILLAYALARVLDLPTRTVGTTLFGSPLGFDLNGPVLMLLLVAALISTGADTLVRSHPRLEGWTGYPTVVHWIVPGAAALALGMLLNRTPFGPLWWLGLGLSAVVLIVALVAEFIVVDPQDGAWNVAALGLTALTYALALVLFALLHSLSARALISATAAGFIAAALAARLLALKPAAPGATLYALAAGLITAEAMWALNYWRVPAGSAALLALLPFYLTVGVAQQHLAGRLTRRLWIEYLIVAALGLLIALLSLRR